MVTALFNYSINFCSLRERIYRRSRNTLFYLPFDSFPKQGTYRDTVAYLSKHHYLKLHWVLWAPWVQMWTNPPYLAGLHLQCLQETWLTLINSLIGIVCLNWMMMLLKTRQKLKALLLNLLKTSLQMQTGLHRARYETLLKEHELLKIHCDTIIRFFSTEFIRIMKSSNGSSGE